MTTYELYLCRVSRATQKVLVSKLPTDAKRMTIDIICLKLAFLYGVQKRHEKKGQLLNLQSQLRERMSWK